MNRTYGHMYLINEGQPFEKWEIQNLEPHVAIRLKHLFPRIPKQGHTTFHIERTDIADADLSWFMLRYPLSMKPDDRAKLKDGRLAFEHDQAEMDRIFLPDYRAPGVIGLRPGCSLRNYQLQFIELVRRRKDVLNGDEGGLGKTYEAAGFLCAERGALPAAVVCDAHMQTQWKEKIEAFTTLRVHCIKSGRAYSLPEADVYVFRISQTHGWTDIFAKRVFKAVIYDEPQSLRNGTKTVKGKACMVLSDHTDYHIGLTATPIYNYGDEMWHIMQFIDDEVLGPWEEFKREWCIPVSAGKFRINDPKALGAYLREQHAMIRRLKADVGMELPKVSKIVEHVDYDVKAVQEVEDLAHRLAIKATTGSFVERGNAARDLDVMMRQVTGVAKAKTVAQFVRILVEAGEPVILWGWHREVYDIWNKELADLKPAMYTGSETSSQKTRSKEHFISGGTDILIMSLRSGAGTDELQHRCSTGVFGELDWSPGIHQQCIWRLDRDGQTNPVTAFFLVTDDGSDPPIMDVLGIKASEARQITDPSLGMQTTDSDISRLRTLVNRYLTKRKEKREQIKIEAVLEL